MPSGPINSVMQQLRKSVLLHDENAVTDRQLLERFASRNEEFAFETMVLRHGPMVLGVCRRVLGNVQDAEDAFQATFLVLARKAVSIGAPELLGNWLYGTAYRTALKAKSQRRVREKQVQDMPHPIIEPDVDCDEILLVLDQELSRLPDKYRVPVVLCDLEGKSRKEVARKLRVPEGTLSSRLATARKMLGKRLAGRGLALSGGTLAATLSQNAASACLPNSLVSSTVRAVASIAAGKVAAGVVSSTVAALTEGVLKGMFLTKLKIGTALVLAAMFFVGGARVLTDYTVAAQPAEPNKQPPSKVLEPPAKAEAKPKDADLIRGTWTIAKVEIGGLQGAEDASEKQVWTIAADKIAIKYPSSVREMKYHLDETQKLKAIDLIPLPETIKSLRLEWKGIYELNGDELKICWDRNMPGERPDYFERKSKNQVRGARAFFILKRAPEAKTEKPEWGDAVNGVQARIRSAKFNSNLPDRDAERFKWGIDEAPTFALDLRNHGEKAFDGFRSRSRCQIEVDGKWYMNRDIPANFANVSTRLEPGKQVDGWVILSLDGSWARNDDNNAKLKVALGKHSVRIAYGDPDSKNALPISNMVEIEVLKETGWGEPVEGVSARIGPEKVEWSAEQAPTFGLDLRNRGEQNFSNVRLPQFCEIEVDGKWYIYGGSINISMPESSLKPGEQVDDWVRVSLDGPWVAKTPGRKIGAGPLGDDKMRLKTAPGKHTVRIAFPLSDKVRPVSQLVEIVVLPASTPAASAKDGAGGDKKSDIDEKYSAPVWGKPQNGLRIGICQSEPKWWADGKWRFMAVLENTGANDVVLRLGDMLGNGQNQVPAAFRLIFTDADGKTRKWQSKLGRIAGRIDPLVVPFGAGCRYALPLNDLADEDPARAGVPLAVGKHRVTVEFVGKAVAKEETNEDVSGFALMRYWTGTVSSAEAAIWNDAPLPR